MQQRKSQMLGKLAVYLAGLELKLTMMQQKYESFLMLHRPGRFMQQRKSQMLGKLAVYLAGLELKLTMMQQKYESFLMLHRPGSE